MQPLTLSATKRTVMGKKVGALRVKGKLPAVLYGHNVATTALELVLADFLKVFRSAGESTLVNLDVDGQNRPVLIHDVAHHYLSGQPLHVDFYAVNMSEKLHARVPLHLLNDAPAVKNLGGVLVKNLSEVEVECLPADLPANFEIDISNLNNFEDAIRISDIKVSDKVKILAHPEEVIVTVAAPRSEEELKELEQKPVTEDVTAVVGVVKPEVVGTEPEAGAAKVEAVKKEETKQEEKSKKEEEKRGNK